MRLYALLSRSRSSSNFIRIFFSCFSKNSCVIGFVSSAIPLKLNSRSLSRYRISGMCGEHCVTWCESFTCVKMHLEHMYSVQLLQKNSIFFWECFGQRSTFCWPFFWGSWSAALGSAVRIAYVTGSAFTSV